MRRFIYNMEVAMAQQKAGTFDVVLRYSNFDIILGPFLTLSPALYHTARAV